MEVWAGIKHVVLEVGAEVFHDLAQLRDQHEKFGHEDLGRCEMLLLIMMDEGGNADDFVKGIVHYDYNLSMSLSLFLYSSLSLSLSLSFFSQFPSFNA